MSVQLQVHEIQEVTTLAKFISYFKIDVFFDIGANVGQYATLLRKKIGFQGVIISYEPFSQAFAELYKNSSDDPNWYVFNYALSDSSGERNLNVVGSSQMNSLEEPTADETTILQNINTKIGQEKVIVKRLDEAYEEAKSVRSFKAPFLKLDTQGHDLKILRASNSLTSFVGVQTEISFKSLYKKTPKYSETIEFLNEHGFELSSIFPNNAGHFPYLLEQDLIAFNKKFLS